MEREESGLELHPEGGLALWRPLLHATCLAESCRINCPLPSTNLESHTPRP